MTGVSVEAELGQLAGVEDDVSVEHSVYTDPIRPRNLWNARLRLRPWPSAPATEHTSLRARPSRFRPLEKSPGCCPTIPLYRASSVPQEIVNIANQYGAQIEGAKGVPEELLRRAAASAVCKINIDTDIRLTMTATIRKYMAENPSHFDPRQYLTPARNAVRDMVAHKIRNVLGSSNKI